MTDKNKKQAEQLFREIEQHSEQASYILKTNQPDLHPTQVITTTKNTIINLLTKLQNLT